MYYSFVVFSNYLEWTGRQTDAQSPYKENDIEGFTRLCTRRSSLIPSPQVPRPWRQPRDLAEAVPCVSLRQFDSEMIRITKPENVVFFCFFFHFAMIFFVERLNLIACVPEAFMAISLEGGPA